MDAQRFLLHSTRGVDQLMEFLLMPISGGFAVRSRIRIQGCLPKPGPGVSTPLSHDNALKWINSRTQKLAKSAAAFRPALSIEQEIEAMFFGV